MSAKVLNQSGIAFTDRREFYPDQNLVLQRYRNVVPYLTYLSSLGDKPVEDPDYKIFESAWGFINATAAVDEGSPSAWSTSAPGATVTVGVDGLSNLGDSVGDHFERLIFDIFNEDKTVFKGQAVVTAVSGSDVTFMYLGNAESSTNAPVALADNDHLKLRHSQSAEGTDAPEAYDDDLTNVYNSAGWIETPVEATTTLIKAYQRGDASEWERLKRNKTHEHLWKLEQALMFSYRSGGTGMGQGTESFGTHQTVGGKTLRTTMGFIPILNRYGISDDDDENQRVFTLSKGTTDYGRVVSITEKIFADIPSDGSKVAQVGNPVITWLSNSTQGGFLGQQGTEFHMEPWRIHEQFGYRVRRLITPHGDIDVMRAPVLEDGYHNNHMAIMDSEFVRVAKFLPTKYDQNIKTENAHKGQKDVWQDYLGLYLGQLSAHSLLKLQ